MEEKSHFFVNNLKLQVRLIKHTITTLALTSIGIKIALFQKMGDNMLKLCNAALNYLIPLNPRKKVMK